MEKQTYRQKNVIEEETHMWDQHSLKFSLFVFHHQKRYDYGKLWFSIFNL